MTFGYEGQKPLFKNLDFGIDMDSRSELREAQCRVRGGTPGRGAGAPGVSGDTSPLTSLFPRAVCIVGLTQREEEHPAAAADRQADAR